MKTLLILSSIPLLKIILVIIAYFLIFIAITVIIFFIVIDTRTNKLQRNPKKGDYCTFYINESREIGKIIEVNENDVTILHHENEYIVNKKEIYL